jgi:PAS domain S-box-containing protein
MLPTRARPPRLGAEVWWLTPVAKYGGFRVDSLPMGALRARDARFDDLAAAGLLQRVAVIANEASTFADAIRSALDEVCSYTGWPVGHAYLPDGAHPDSLDPLDVWHLDDPERFETFRAITERTILGAGAGLPGRILENGMPAWITDVSIDSNFPRNRTTQDIVVRGGFGFPVMAAHRVVAVMEFFSERPEPRDERLLHLVSYVGTQLGRVAEREIAAAAVQKQIDEMRRLVELAFDAFVSIDMNGTITGWNAAAETMFGWSRDEALGRQLAETIVPPSYRQAHRAGLRRYLETREAHVLNKYIELAAIRRDGREFPIELAIWPVGSNGETTFCAFVRDISERKQAEETLARLATIVESSDDAMIAKSLDGTILSWNGGAERMYGYAAEEVVGTSISVLVPEDHNDLADIMNHIARGESLEHHETRRRRKDGRVIDVALTVSPIKNASGEVVGAATITRDVSTRKQAEERLRESERSLRDAQRIVRVGSWEWDVTNDLVTWSDQLYRNFGITREDFVPSFEGYLTAVHTDDRERVQATIVEALQRHEHFEFEHRVPMPDGTERVHFCTGDVFVEGGRAVRMAGTSQDITERKEAADRLQAAYEHEREMVQKLRELDTVKTNFVSSVSHELRTPLTSITGYVELLLDGGGDALTADQRDMLDVVQRNSVRLLGLIEDLLTVSRLESGTIKASMEPVAVGPLVSAVRDAVLPAANDRSIDLQAEIHDDAGWVLGDPGQLERVLLNVLSNALKFTPPGGKVRVGADRCGDNIVLSVMDTGIGIPEDEQQNLFTRFFRASNAQTGTAPGTGLGLTIVKAIVDEHNGSIDVHSSPASGTTVEIRLKASDRPPTTEAD